MNININASKMMPNEDSNITEKEIVDYAEKIVEHALSIMEGKNISANVVLKTEGPESDKVQKVDVCVFINGTTIKQSSHSRNMRKALDDIKDPLRRQIRDMKEKMQKIAS